MMRLFLTMPHVWVMNYSFIYSICAPVISGCSVRSLAFVMFSEYILLMVFTCDQRTSLLHSKDLSEILRLVTNGLSEFLVILGLFIVTLKLLSQSN